MLHSEEKKGLLQRMASKGKQCKVKGHTLGVSGCRSLFLRW